MEVTYIDSTELISSIVELKKKADKMMDYLVKDIGITKIQALVLINIYNKESCVNCSVNDIVNELELNQGNTSSLLKKMETLGLIEKIKAQDDERKVTLNLTLEGKEKVDEIYKRINEFKDRINNEYSEQKKIKLIEGMKEMNNFFEFLIEEEKS